MSTCASGVTSFFRAGLVFLHYDNLCCSGFFIFQHGSRIPYTMSTCAAAVSPFFQHWSRITYIISTWYATVTSFYSTRPLLPTLCQLVMQRLFHFSATITYYLHYVNTFCSGYFILKHWSRITYTLSTCAAAVISFFSTALILPTLWHHVLQRVLHFTALVSYYLDYVNRCFSV
jgi:hypothetical protein